jgi:hypothetical protein
MNVASVTVIATTQGLKRGRQAASRSTATDPEEAREPLAVVEAMNLNCKLFERGLEFHAAGFLFAIFRARLV